MNYKWLKLGDTGLQWAAGSMILGDAEVIIPIDQLGDMSDEEIGEWVRLFVPRAVEAFSEEMIEGQGVGGVFGYAPDKLEELMNIINRGSVENHYTAVLYALVTEAIKKGQATKPVKARTADNSGFVYLAYAETGHYKIGISKDPEGRIKVFDTQMPIEVRIIHRFKADNYRAAEADLHDKFQDKHHTGEWFNLDIMDCNYIRSIQSYTDGRFNYKGK